MEETKLAIQNEFINEDIKNLIYTIRNKQVMLDSDVAMLYHYETKKVNQAVKRNIDRFPERFCFKLTKSEFESLRSQIVTSKIENYDKVEKRGGRRDLPYVFTEQGLYMLMTVLSGKLAEKQSIALVRTFKKMKDYIIENQGLIGERVSSIIYESCGACILLYTEKFFADIINMTYS